MMDKTYIQEHGILELYVLGELNESDQNKLEQMLIKHPDLKEELTIIEDNFEKVSFENAILPSQTVKQKLLQTVSKTNTKTISLKSNTKFKNTLSIAASIAAILLIGSIYFYSQWNSTQNKLKLAEDKNTELNNKIDQLTKDYTSTNALYTSINDVNTEKYILTGNDLMPNAKLISYVNDINKSVIINTTYLPELDEEHDYQMWADVKGEMIDMGVINTNTTMLAMNYIDNSESLNITIEPSGGSDHPTVSKLITNVYLK